MRVVRQVVEQLGDPDGIIAFDPSSFPKRGTHSVGVKRQWCSHRGKVDNCQVGVFMGYVSRHDHALLDFRLALPEDWARDEQRRAECHVPPEVRYHTRHEQCLEMLDEWGEQVPQGWVTGDEELGRHTRFRGELRERGERYVLGVPCTTAVRDLEVPSPAYQGRGRRPKAPWQLARAWRTSLPSAGWTHVTRYCWRIYFKVLEVLFSCASFPSFFAFKEGMYDTQISALLSSPTVSDDA